MKLINEKGKLFGIINLVDLLVLLLVIAVVAVVGVKLFGTKAVEVVSAKSDCYAEIEVIGANPRLYNEVDRQMDKLIGARMVTGNEYLSATIEDIWYEPYNILATNSDGYVVASIDETRVSIVFLVKTQVSPDAATLSIGSQELRSGKTFIVKTQALETSGTIRYVNVGEYDGEGRANEISLDEFKAGL
ncbi:MAG: DUF4330 domain-containing protein [Clostridia bacterium]|nr:DUF4330 domain-containing protein [Clostridia bacterium]